MVTKVCLECRLNETVPDNDDGLCPECRYSLRATWRKLDQAYWDC